MEKPLQKKRKTIKTKTITRVPNEQIDLSKQSPNENTKQEINKMKKSKNTNIQKNNNNLTNNSNPVKPDLQIKAVENNTNEIKLKEEKKNNNKRSVEKISFNTQEQTVKTLSPSLINWHMYFKAISILKPAIIVSRVGKEFKIQRLIIIDKEGAEIELTFFDEKIKRFGSKIKQFGEYVIVKGSIKPNLNCYGYSLNSNKLQTNVNTGIREINCIKDFPQFAEPTPIKMITHQDINNYISVGGMAFDVEILTNQVSRNGKVYDLVKFMIADKTAKISVQVWGKDSESYTNIEGKILWIRHAKIYQWNQTIQLNSKGYIIIDADEINESLKDIKQWYLSTQNKQKNEDIPNLSALQTIDWSSIPFIPLNDAEQNLQNFAYCKTKPLMEIAKIKGIFITLSQPNKKQWYWGARKFNYAGCILRENGQFWCKKCQQILEKKEVEERWALKIIITDDKLKRKIPMTIIGEKGTQFMKITAKEAHQKEIDGSWVKFIQEKENKSWIFGIKTQFRTFKGNTQMQYVVDYLERDSKIIKDTNNNKIEEEEYDPTDGWL